MRQTRRRKEVQLPLFDKAELLHAHHDPQAHDLSGPLSPSSNEIANHRRFYRTMRKSQLLLDLRSDSAGLSPHSN